MKKLSFKSALKRIKSEKGISGVIVALGLVVVGIGMVAATKTVMDSQTSTMTDQVNTKMNELVTN